MASKFRTAAARVAACRLTTARASSAGLEPILRTLPPDEARRLALLARDWHARLLPVDAVERANADLVVGAHRRRLLLDRVEMRLLEAMAEGRSTEGLPSLGVLGRARLRAEAEQRAALADLKTLAASHGAEAPPADAARLAWLAERAAAQEAMVASICGRPFAAPEVGPRPEPERRSAPGARPEAAARAAHVAPEPDVAATG